MEISVSDAKAKLTNLIARAEAGEEIVVTRHGQAAARIVPAAKPKLTIAERRAILQEIVASAQKNMTPGPSSKELQDEMYDENGLPK